MIYQAGDMLLHDIRDVFRGEKNDVVICRDENSQALNCYVLLVVKDRECAKKLIRSFENSEKLIHGGAAPDIACFTQNELLCVAFDYRPERRLFSFYEAQIGTLAEREEICVNLIMECLSSELPYPLLYMALSDDNIHIAKDNSVYFTPYFDLAEFDETRDEASCAGRCAEVMVSLLGAHIGRKPRSLLLIEKKVDRGAYQSLPELFMDLKATSVPREKFNFKERWKRLWGDIRDRLFRVLLIACVISVGVCLIFLVSQLIFGDIPILRIFENSFEVIGTESLK